MPLRRLDQAVGRAYRGLHGVWRETTFREIYGVGMMILALGFVVSPRGSLLNVVHFIPGMTPFLFAVYTLLSGYLLAKYGWRGSGHRFIYSLPLVIYIAATVELTILRWPDSSLAPAIIYIMAYAGLIRAISVQER